MSRLLFISILTLLLSSCKNDSNTNSNVDSSMGNNAKSETLFDLLLPSDTGVDFENPIEETISFNHLNWQSIYMGGGVGLVDINNDGLLDIYFAGNEVSDKLYLNKGNMKFVDISTSAGIDRDKLWSNGVSFADVNGDGYQDIYVCNTHWSRDPMKRKNRLYINQKNNTFIERGMQFGLDDDGYSMQASFFDFDNDGDLDMFLCNEPIDTRLSNDIEQKGKVPTKYNSNKLYRNINNKSFVDISKAAGVWSFSYSLSGTNSDLDKDGNVDIYVCNDFSIEDYLYMNNGDLTFSNITKKAFNHISNFSMGSDIADINNDGLNDILTVDMAGSSHYRSKTNMGSMSNETFWNSIHKGHHYQYMYNTLQLNNGNNTYSDIAQLAHISSTDWSWGILAADFDNDASKDIVVSNGIKKDIRNNDLNEIITKKIKEGNKKAAAKYALENMVSTPIANFMFRNNGDLSFDDVTKDWGLFHPGFSNGIAYGDLDNDGDLDLVVNNISAVASVYENSLNGKQNYLKLNLTGPKGNMLANGAKVTIYTGDDIQYVEVNGTRGYFSYSDPRPHFGLGSVEIIDKVEVIWPGDGKMTVLKDVKVNQILNLDIKDASGTFDYNRKKEATHYVEISKKIGLDFVHKENKYDDFLREILIPYKQSQNGPYISIADVNGDNIEDLFIGNGHGSSAKLYIGSKNNGYSMMSGDVFDIDKNYEDLESIFFDSDGDGDLDLYVVSGGNEDDIDAPIYQDRLYINDGKGHFSKSTIVLPNMTTSTQSVVSSDVDGDGDLDLFVGGRLIPGKYPQTPESYLLINENGKFVNKAKEYGLDKVGMVTKALFSDYDKDGDDDLVLVGEWMPITFFRNTGGKFENKTSNSGIEKYTGIWWTIQEGDFDGDGDMDYIAGNLSKNNKFHASLKKPFIVYNADFDENGTNDIVLAKYSGDKVVPSRGRECSSQQMPFIKDKFPTFDGFAKASIDDILPKVKGGLRYEATTLASAYIENNGDGTFSYKELPNSFQTAPLRSIITLDVNGDGHLDWMGVGNNYQAEVETTRYDAGIGYTAINDGKGNFTFMPTYESGFYDQNDTRDIKVSKEGVIFVSENRGPLKIFRKK